MKRQRTIVTPIDSTGAIEVQSLLIEKSIWQQLIEATWMVVLNFLAIISFLAIIGWLL